MERGYYKAYVEHLTGVLCLVLQSNGYCHYCVYSIDPFDYAASNFEADSADEGHDYPTTENERDSRTVCRGSGQNIPGNHENVQGSWSQSSGLCWPSYYPAANIDWVI